MKTANISSVYFKSIFQQLEVDTKKVQLFFWIFSFQTYLRLHNIYFIDFFASPWRVENQSGCVSVFVAGLFARYASARISNLVSSKKRFISLDKQYVDEKNHRTIPFALFIPPVPPRQPHFLPFEKRPSYHRCFLTKVKFWQLKSPFRRVFGFQVPYPTYHSVRRFLFFVCFSAAGVLETFLSKFTTKPSVQSLDGGVWREYGSKSEYK